MAGEPIILDKKHGWYVDWSIDGHMWLAQNLRCEHPPMVSLDGKNWVWLYPKDPKEQPNG